jgi:multidrug efflux pump
MKITELAIRNRVAVILLALLLSVVGLVAYLTIPKESQPQIEFATIVVTTIYPGASPGDIESIITQAIEREIQGINGIDELRSTSTEGVSTVVIEFLPSVDVRDAKVEVRDAVDRAKGDFPADVEEPIVSEIDTSEFPVITVNLAASYSLAQLRDVAEEIQDEIEGIPGILEVNLIGGIEREVQVNVDLAALQGYNLTFNDVVEVIRDENTNIPGGSIDVDRLNYLVRVDGEFRDPREIEGLVVSTPAGRPIYIRDIAEVVFGFKDRSSYARLEVLQEEVSDGVYVPIENVRNLQVVSLIVKKRPGANIIETVESVRSTVEGFPMPAGTEVTYTGDASENVRTLVKDLENNIIAGLIFVISVLLFFLGVRNATLVGIAIPLSMFIAFILFAAMGQTLNFIILFSLIIALGMLVDNAVVIVENIYRYREEGYDRWEAARLATAEVGGAVAASTATTVAAFAPMLFWPGIIGRFMSYLPLTLIVVLSASLFVALIINPVVTGYLVRLEGEKTPGRGSFARRLGYVAVAVTALLVGLTNWRTLVFAAIAIPLVVLLHKLVLNPIALRFQERTVPRMTSQYRRFLNWMLDRDYGVRRALLRNTLALGSFTGGFILAVIAMMLAGIGTPVVDLPMGPGQVPFSAAGLVVIVPALLLLVTGVAGILFHALESIFLGAGLSVKTGLVFGGVLGLLILALLLGGRIESPVVVIALIGLPAVIVIGGLLGVLFRGDRTYLVLTDNRARLLTATFAMLIAIIALFQVAPTGVVFFPETDPNQVQIGLEAPLGTNLESSNEIANEAFGRIDALLAQNDASRANTKTILTQVGVGGDVIFGGGSARPERSRVTLNMVDYGSRAEPSPTTLRRIRDEIVGLPGVTIEISKDQQGPPTGKPVNIEVTGDEFSQIVAIATDVREMLERGRTLADDTGQAPLAGLVDVTDNVDSGRPEFRVEIDRERAASFGLSTQQIASTVRSAVAGVEASTYRTGENEYDIMVRLREADRASLESLQSLTILYEGSQIPLVSVATIEIGSGLGAITRKAQQRVVTVSGDAAEGVNGNELLGRVQQHLAPYVAALPAGYSVRYTGESEEQQESFGFLFTALLIGIALISIILIWQFNSIKNPLIIMIATGLSLIGVMLGLIITRTPFGLMTFIGIISLAGIVVNNAIVLVDYIEQLREKRGLDKRAAVVEGGATRLRPVILTALTTVIGLIPLTFGINIDFIGLVTNLDPNLQFGSENTQFWGPMGTAIISGLTFATFLTLVIVPVMYSTFDSIATRFSEAIRPASLETHGALVPAPAGLITAGDGSPGNGATVDSDPVRPAAG